MSNRANVTPFTVRISDDSLAQLDTLLRLSPIADPTYETSLPDGSRKFGMWYDWLTKAVDDFKRGHSSHDLRGVNMKLI
jgi:microsomal epoxide hydrolase